MPNFKLLKVSWGKRLDEEALLIYLTTILPNISLYLKIIVALGEASVKVAGFVVLSLRL